MGVAGGFPQRQPSDAVGEDHQPGPEDGPRLADVAPLAPAHEHPSQRCLAGARKRGGPFALGHLAERLPAKGRRVLRFEDESELPRPATIPGQRHDEFGIAARLRLHDQSALFAEHRHVLDRRLGTDGDPGHGPSLERLWRGGFRQRGGADESGEDRPLLSIDLIPIGIGRRPGADDHRSRAARRMPGNVELHPAGDDHRGRGIGGCGKIEKKDKRSGDPPSVGNRDGAGPHGRLDEAPSILEIGRPRRHPHRGLPGYHHRFDLVLCAVGRFLVVRSGRGVALIGNLLALVFGLHVIGGDDLERDRRVVMDPSEETTTIDFEEDGGEYRAGMAGPPAGGTHPGFERHSAASAGRQFERHRVGAGTESLPLEPIDRPADLPDARAGHFHGNRRPGHLDVGAFEQVEQSLFERRHAARVHRCESGCCAKRRPEDGGAQHAFVPCGGGPWGGGDSSARFRLPAGPPDHSLPGGQRRDSLKPASQIPSPRRSVRGRSRPASADGRHGRG